MKCYVPFFMNPTTNRAKQVKSHEMCRVCTVGRFPIRDTSNDMYFIVLADLTHQICGMIVRRNRWSYRIFATLSNDHLITGNHMCEMCSLCNISNSLWIRGSACSQQLTGQKYSIVIRQLRNNWQIAGLVRRFFASYIVWVAQMMFDIQSNLIAINCIRKFKWMNLLNYFGDSTFIKCNLNNLCPLITDSLVTNQLPNRHSRMMNAFVQLPQKLPEIVFLFSTN